MDAAPAPEKHWIRTILLIAALLVGLAYWNAPKGGFVYDDQWQVVRNPLIQDPGLWSKALTSDVWAFKTGGEASASNYYRPTFTGWSIANFAVFSLDPAGWHVANILLHLLATALVCLVLVRLNFSPIVIAVATWIFAAHPVHVESVTWIAGSPDPLMTIFLMYSLWVYLGMREKPSPRGWALALISMALAMGAKESSFMFVGAIFVAEWLLSRHESKPKPVATAFRAAIPFSMVALGFFLLRSMLLGQIGINPQNPAPLADVLLSIPQLFQFYLVHAVLPLDLSTAYPLRAVTPTTMSVQTFWIPLVVMIMVLGGAWFVAKSRPRAWFGIALCLILAPSFYIRAFHPEHIVRDRYLYLPLLGLALILFEALTPREESKTFRWSPSAAIGLVVAAIFAYLSMSYNPVWANEVAFWQRGVATDPKGSFATMQLAEAQRVEKDLGSALTNGLKAVELDPNNVRARTILAMTYRDQGDLRNAEREFRTVVQGDKDTSIAAGNLAELLAKQGRFDEAVQVFEGEIVKYPAFEAKGKQNIAILWMQSGDRSKAKAALESSLPALEKSTFPSVLKSYYMLAEVYEEEGNTTKANEYFSLYLKRTDGNADSEAVKLRELAQSRVGN